MKKVCWLLVLLLLLPLTGLADSMKCEHDWKLYYEEEATCLSPAIAIWMCSNCYETKTEETAPALTDHAAPEPVWQSNCYGQGYMQFCEICNSLVYADDYEWFDAPAHEPLGVPEVTVPATCTDQEYSEVCCAKCGDWYMFASGPARTDHAVPEAVPYSDCYGTGTAVICSICGTFEYGEDYDWYDEPRHVPDGEPEVTHEATCYEPGYSEAYCSVCGDWYLFESAPMRTDHAMPEAVPYSDCYGEGTAYICDICGFLDYGDDWTWYEEEKHVQGEWLYAIHATCLEEGTETYSCAVCGDWVTVVTEPIRTDHAPAEPVTTETCYGFGTLYSCDVCGAFEYGEDWEMFDEPRHEGTLLWHEKASCFWEGYDVMQCSKCGDIYYVPVESEPALTDHIRPDEMTETNCFRGQGLAYWCPVCQDGYGYAEEYTDYELDLSDALQQIVHLELQPDGAVYAYWVIDDTVDPQALPMAVDTEALFRQYGISQVTVIHGAERTIVTL